VAVAADSSDREDGHGWAVWLLAATASDGWAARGYEGDVAPTRAGVGAACSATATVTAGATGELGLVDTLLGGVYGAHEWVVAHLQWLECRGGDAVDVQNESSIGMRGRTGATDKETRLARRRWPPPAAATLAGGGAQPPHVFRQGGTPP